MLSQLIDSLPKVELHLHLEGTLEPEMALLLAERNRLDLPYRSSGELSRAYRFTDLQTFLDLYYALCAVLITGDDFYDLTAAYLRRAAADNVRHAEVFFDPRSHTSRGVPLADLLAGIDAARRDCERDLGITCSLVPCFLRHESEQIAQTTLDELLLFRDSIIGVGLDSSERDHPPGDFARVFARARAHGLHAVAHAGEEGPATYVSDALDLLNVERIDHGVRCEEDEALVERLATARIPLTVCPLSNVKLGVFGSMADHNLKRLLDRRLCVSIHSDDPAYFGGYISDNYRAVVEALQLDAGDLGRLAENAVVGSFLPAPQKARIVTEIRALTAGSIAS